MYFYIPTKIYSEKNCVRNHSKELASLGTKAFIITGKTSAKINGSLDAVIDALNSESIPYCIYDKIEENPSIETVMDAAEIGRKEQVNFVIGIGGGSPMDAAKAIALMIYNSSATAEILYQKIVLPALPVVAIPTTAGTGSEATPYAILTIHSQKTKGSISHRIFPELALVDYTYLETVPKTVLINTAVDTLGHLVESYVNVNATLYSKMLCDSAFRLWSSIKNVLLGQQPQDEDYEKLMTASTVAGMAISHTGTSLPHGLSYYLTYEKDIPHGKAVGIFLAAYLAANPDDTTGKHILDLLGFDSYSSFSEFILKLLGDVMLSEDEVDRYVQGIMNNKGKLVNCPYQPTTDIIKKIFQDSVIIQ